eukprot:gene34664-41978_t
MDCFGGSKPKKLFAELLLRVIYIDHATPKKHGSDLDDHDMQALDVPDEDKYLPDEILLSVPNVLTCTELIVRLQGHYDLLHKVSFVFSGRVLGPEEHLPQSCFESFEPVNEDFDFFRPRLVMCVAVDCPLDLDDHDDMDNTMLTADSHDDEVDSMEEELARERQRAGRFKDPTPLFDMRAELALLGCAQYADMLERAGYLEEGCFAQLTEETFAHTVGLYLPADVRSKCLQLGVRVREKLAEHDEKLEHSNLLAKAALEDRRMSKSVAPQPVNAVVALARKAKHVDAAVRAKMLEIEKRQALDDSIHLDRRYSSQLDDLYASLIYQQRTQHTCCAAHEEKIRERKAELRLHNMQCFAQELQSSLAWLRCQLHELAGLHSLLDVSLEVIHRAGWVSMTKEVLLREVAQGSLIDKAELDELEKIAVHPRSVLQDRSLFADRQYMISKFVHSLILFLDRANSDFFYSYSIT